jgi:acetyltransferase-like isoleucine patch superfamily enzyme
MRSASPLQAMRIAWYRREWSCERIEGNPRLAAPVLLAGAGSAFEREVTLGWESSSGSFEGYSYVEARNSQSVVSFGEGTLVNNGVTIVSEGPGITIGKRCLIGLGVHVYDSDFHPLAALSAASHRRARRLLRSATTHSSARLRSC